MKTLASRLALTLLAIGLSSPAIAQNLNAAKACKSTRTSGECMLRLITTLQGQVTTLQGQVTSLQGALTSMQNNRALKLDHYITVVAGTKNGLKGPHVIFKGVNVHIESGSGTTVDTTGLGNLVVGYNEDSLDASTIDANRTGSHNLVVGPQHAFTASGSVVGGYANFTSANYASVTGGECNAAGSTPYPISCTPSSGASDAASVSGGSSNTASGAVSSVSGGSTNSASGIFSSVSGGGVNMASGLMSSISGGEFNTANGELASRTAVSTRRARFSPASAAGRATRRAALRRVSAAASSTRRAAVDRAFSEVTVLA